MGCCGAKSSYPLFNFAATPGSDENFVESVQTTVVDEGQNILQQLRTYKGCEAAIREAITNPNQETESRALVQLLPAVDILHRFFDFSKKIEETLPILFAKLCSDNPISTIETHQVTARMLGEIFDFVLRFDDLKMVNPAIQNDFSYYRRTLNRLKLAKQDSREDIKVTGEIANRMSLFYAYPTPMMRVTIDTTSHFISNNAEGPKLVTALGHLTNFYTTFLMNAQKEQVPADQTLKVAAYLTGSICLYDQVSQNGAFKKSPIMILEAFKGVKAFSQQQALFANAIRFTTLHFNDANTPQKVKDAL